MSSFSSSRARILAAVRESACEQGYHAVSVTAVITLARVSSKTFYENFTDLEECFIAAYDEATAEIEAVMRPAYMRPGAWAQRIRAALEALLKLLEADRELAILVFLEAPKARELLGGRRVRILEILRLVLDSGRSGQDAAVIPVLMDELLVEGAISVIRARVASRQTGAVSRLIDELMGVIVYSYVGLANGVDDPPRLAAGEVLATSAGCPDVARSGKIRLTYRTLQVLKVLAQNPGASNRVVAELSGVSDQGQISKLLHRLSRQRLIHNRGQPRKGAPKRWHLTESGSVLQRRGQRDLELMSAAAG